MREIAVNNSKGQIIMSIDDDCVADRGAISQIVKCFMADETIGIVGGNITNVGFKGNERFKGRGKIGVNGNYEIAKDLREADVFGSANMSIRKKVFDEVGGYDLFFRGGLEEADLCLSVKRKGYRVVYEPSVKIDHYHSHFRFRSRWKNVNILRLYLFFKHFMPRTITDWMKFLKLEMKILVAEIKPLMRQSVFRAGKRNVEKHPNTKHVKRSLFHYPRKLYRKCRQLFNILIPRIIIPYLIHKARKVRTSE